MMNSSGNTSKIYMYLTVVLGIVMLGVVTSQLINQTKNTSSKQDIRSRASATAGITVTGVIEQIDTAGNKLQINNVQFSSSPGKNMGSWSVTPPTEYNIQTNPIGTKVTINADSTSFSITSHTLTAKEIKK